LNAVADETRKAGSAFNNGRTACLWLVE